MSPRTYDSSARRAASGHTRTRVLEAARDLLAHAGPDTRFSIDAVAKRAGVARMTVYYQFESRRGLLEALFDSLAAQAGIARISEAYGQPDPRDALAAVIRFFSRWWECERTVMRRLRAEAALDPELDEALAGREALKRFGLRNITGRLVSAGALPLARASEVEDELFALTSFQVYDLLAGDTRDALAVADLVVSMAEAIIAGSPLQTGSHSNSPPAAGNLTQGP